MAQGRCGFKPQIKEGKMRGYKVALVGGDGGGDRAGRPAGAGEPAPAMERVPDRRAGRGRRARSASW